MKTEHKYAQVLRWIASGEKLQWKPDEDGNWRDLSERDIIKRLAEGNAAPPEWFRLNPRTITVNGREVQAGETVAPEAEFFFVDLHSTDLWGETFWCGTNRDQLKLERGLVHLTKEAAIAHAKAMLNID